MDGAFGTPLQTEGDPGLAIHADTEYIASVKSLGFLLFQYLGKERKVSVFDA